MSPSQRPVIISTLKQMKDPGERISMLAAYDFTMATLLEQDVVDVLLVGYSLGTVVQGHSTTIPVTLGEMTYHGTMVARVAKEKETGTHIFFRGG